VKKGPSRIAFKLDFFSSVPPLTHIYFPITELATRHLFSEMNRTCLAIGIQDGLRG
jgi:hypothetical protein